MLEKKDPNVAYYATNLLTKMSQLNERPSNNYAAGKLRRLVSIICENSNGLSATDARKVKRAGFILNEKTYDAENEPARSPQDIGRSYNSEVKLFGKPSSYIR